MAMTKLDKKEWRGWFDAIAKELPAKHVEIEVAALSIGSQIEAEWLPLLGIAYDEKIDLLEILLDGLDHLIRHPREVHVDRGIAGLNAMVVVDGDGFRQVIKLRDPLLLPLLA